VEAWGNHLQLLTGDIEQSRLQTTASLVMRKYLEYLNPGRVTKASPTFNAYTRAWLTRYLQLHRRVPKRSPVEEWVASTVQVWRAASPVRLPRLRPSLTPVAMRVTMTYAVLIAALLLTGTARAQSALPGDLLYGWKRTTEDAWVALSPDPVGARIILADRRLEEWLAVENDPQRSATALDEYLRTMIALNTDRDPQVTERLEPVIAAHKKKLSQSGVPVTDFSDLLGVAVNPTVVTSPTDVASTPVVAVPTTAGAENQERDGCGCAARNRGHCRGGPDRHGDGDPADRDRYERADRDPDGSAAHSDRYAAGTDRDADRSRADRYASAHSDGRSH
jgi:hypothetical protein